MAKEKTGRRNDKVSSTSRNRGNRKVNGSGNSKSTTNKNANVGRLSTVLYDQNPGLPQPSINTRVPFNDLVHLINIPSNNTTTAKIPTHFYSMKVLLTGGKDHLSRATAIDNWYTLLRGAKTQFSDFRPIDLANYQHACHFVKLVAVYVEETIRMIDAKSFSDASVNYKLVQSLNGALYENKTAFDDDIKFNYSHLRDEYARFREWVLSKCFVIDSYNVKIDQMMHAGFVDDNVSYEVAPVLIFNPYIAAYLEASHTYDPITGKPTAFTTGEISFFPCPYNDATKDKWYTMKNTETWLQYLARIMQQIQIKWGSTFDTIASYLAGITGVSSNMVCPPEHIITPWAAQFDPILRSQVRNATLMTTSVCLYNGSAYTMGVRADNNDGAEAHIRSLLTFKYSDLLTKDHTISITFPGTGITDVYVPTNTVPGGSLHVPQGVTVQPAIHPVSIDSSLQSIEDVPSIAEMIAPLTVSATGTEVRLEFDYGVVVPYCIVVDNFERNGEMSPITRTTICNRAITNDTLAYVTFMAFHTSWCKILPNTTSIILNSSTGIVDAYENVDYEQLAKMSADSISDGHRTAVQSFWTQWTAKPNGAYASAEKRVKN